jgi:very-short-patch-repair endonuclease
MPEESAKCRLDKAIARLAGRQHGVLSVQQLYSFGISSSSVSDRVASGRLHRIHRGVYAVGHSRLSNGGRWMAAVLACGDGAVLSHRSAGELWGILRRRAHRLSAAGGRAEAEPMHVTVTGNGGRKRHRGISLHRSATLTTADCTRRDGIPVTKPARTLGDLRSALSEAEFGTALREAEFLGLAVAGLHTDSEIVPRTRSELETRFLAVVRRHRLPEPEANVRIDRYEVDFLWRDQRLIVEADGWESHRTRSAFEGDRVRDARLKTLGYEVLRFTWRQIEGDAHGVAAAIRGLLSRGP